MVNMSGCVRACVICILYVNMYVYYNTKCST